MDPERAPLLSSVVHVRHEPEQPGPPQVVGVTKGRPRRCTEEGPAGGWEEDSGGGQERGTERGWARTRRVSEDADTSAAGFSTNTSTSVLVGTNKREMVPQVRS